MGDQSGSDWTEAENAKAIEEYFSMLALQRSGEDYVKAEFNRRVQKATGRSRGAVEYKFQNISAVLEPSGHPFVSGYAPAWHVQELLRDRVVEHVALMEPRAAYAAETAATLARVPPPFPLDSDNRRYFQNLAEVWNAAERDRKNRELGDAGEWLVFEDEKRRLYDAGMKDYANRVEWTSKARGDGQGYDIRSFTESGQRRLLEVKTTRGGERTPFFLTANERNVSRQQSDVWRLIRLFDFGGKPRAFKLAPPLDDVLQFECREWRTSP